MMQLEKIPGPAKAGREAMYSKNGQEFAYRSGAYGYQGSVAFVPKMAVIAGYVKHFGMKRILDIGCGTGAVLHFLDKSIGYIGVDISQTAIRQARKAFGDKSKELFYVADFRKWQCPIQSLGGVIWAGIGFTWTQKGRGGDCNDWLDIVASAGRVLSPDGYMILEAVTEHIRRLEDMLEATHVCVTGCDLDCFQSEESPKRSIRVLRCRNT